MAKVRWTQEPDQQDYPAALSYLSLLLSADAAVATVSELRKADIVHVKAKDILRAARLPRLPIDNPHVAKDLKRISKRVPLSPVLLVRGELVSGSPMQIADGYHRVCASYHVNEDTDIPCRIVAQPSARAGGTSPSRTRR